ncbi:MAG: hypothetical protein KA791_15780 [Flavobacteriales bacterium]|nr:hypothetical protein [Flavobacteriales bacterium]
MTGPVNDKEQQRVIVLFPAALRGLIEAEIAAGNRIIHAGAGHPAPPAGEQVMFAEDLKTRKKTAKDGLRFHERESSSHHQEITDDQGFFWILTAPLPPPPDPDMNAIRAAHRVEYTPPPVVVKTFAHDTVEMDIRGEMLILHEEGRRTDIIWTWNKGNYLYRSSLSAWWYPAERRSQPMTDEEKETVLERFMAYGRSFISSTIELRD